MEDLDKRVASGDFSLKEEKRHLEILEDLLEQSQKAEQEAWEVEEPEGLQAFFHLMPGMAANLFKSFLVFLEMTIAQSSLGLSFGIPFL